MGIRKKIADLWETPSGVALIFWAIVLLSDFALILVCLVIIGFLFGLEALAYFSLGILIVIGLVIAYLFVSKELIGGLSKLMGRSR